MTIILPLFLNFLKSNNQPSQILIYITFIPFIIILIKSMIKILGETEIERLLTSRKEKTINKILTIIYILVLIVLYFNFFGFMMRESFNIDMLQIIVNILLTLFSIGFLLLTVYYIYYILVGKEILKDNTMRIYIITLFSFYSILILALHVFLFSVSEKPLQLFTQEGYLSFTALYVLVFLALLEFANYILGNNIEYRIKIISGTEVDERLNNKTLYLVISKNILVFRQPHVEGEINEYYLYYLNKNKLIIYFNEKSTLYLNDRF